MYDCIIVGSGPAGGTAAYHLAKKGHSILILDKADLPRYKPCGGGVSSVIQEWFDFDFTPAVFFKNQHGLLYMGTRKSHRRRYERLSDLDGAKGCT